MGEWYIQPNWLEAIKGRPLFYPCAANDLEEIMTPFLSVVDEFWFADVNYPQGMNLSPGIQDEDKMRCRLKSSYVDGDPNSVLTVAGGHRNIKASRHFELYRRFDGSKLLIVRRRGFAQIALGDEFKDGSLGVFCHRGDSQGEGGSNVYFFRNHWSRFPPLRNLAKLLTCKLAHRAVVVSDGSNAARGHPVAKFHFCQLSGAEAYEQLAGQNWTRDGLRWTCVGFLTNRYGPTLVWGVVHIDSN